MTAAVPRQPVKGDWVRVSFEGEVGGVVGNQMKIGPQWLVTDDDTVVEFPRRPHLVGDKITNLQLGELPVNSVVKHEMGGVSVAGPDYLWRSFSGITNLPSRYHEGPYEIIYLPGGRA